MHHFKANLMLSLNMVFFFMFGQLLDPCSGIYRGINQNQKKRPLNKNVILYSFIYHFKAKIMLSLNMVLFLCLDNPLTPIPGLTAGKEM